jgi:dienelactone hydrolase
MEEQICTYRQGDTTCRGWLVYDKGSAHLRPGIVIAHAWRGLDDFTRQKARELAALGYVVLAADLYGEGLTADNDTEAGQLMLPLFLDRALLRQRIQAALDALQKVAVCDHTRLGAIGFCFGGLTVIELVRSGAPIRGAVSFHGVLRTAMGNQHATLAPLARHIPSALLVLQGHDDPLVSAEDIAALQNEMTTAHVDWQIHTYGHTSHAFTNPEANDTVHGLVYNKQSARRSWRSMQNFFEEIFQ